MRKAALEEKVRELTWENSCKTCTISDQINRTIQLKAKIEGLEAANTKQQLEHDAEMYKCADDINRLRNVIHVLEMENEKLKKPKEAALNNFRTGIEKLIQENGLDGRITVHIYTR